jgi:hypothetical protein
MGTDGGLTDYQYLPFFPIKWWEPITAGGYFIKLILG